jgi:hypothetical protein
VKLTCAVAVLVAILPQCGKADFTGDGCNVHAQFAGSGERFGPLPGWLVLSRERKGLPRKAARMGGSGQAFCWLARSGIMSESTDRFQPVVMNPSPFESTGSSAMSSARCPRCRRVFDCGARGGREACWCVSMPAMPTEALDAGTGCLCPECLADAIARTRAVEGSAAPAPD